MAHVLEVTVRVREGDGEKYALFCTNIADGDEVLEKLEPISLSRKFGNCKYPLSDLQGHDSHAPPFHDDELMEEYIDRVLEDIEQEVDKIGLEVVVVRKTDDSGSEW